MKTYNEMAENALQKINEYEKVREKKRKTIARIAAPALSLCLVALIGIGVSEKYVSKPSQPPQGFITTQSNSDATASKDHIVVNLTDGMPAKRIKVDVSEEDFVKMSNDELKDYFGMDIFPDVSSDLKSWDKADDFNGHGIYRRNKGTGEVYWDQTILNYSNDDFTRGVNIEIAKGKLPVVDFGMGDEAPEESTISGTSVCIGYDGSDCYQARFICNDTGFVLSTNGLSQEEVVKVIKSIIE